MLKITKASHLDHALTGAHLAYILATFADRDAFFIATIKLPADMGGAGFVPCALYGPSMGDPIVTEDRVTRVQRPGRTYLSRVFKPGAPEITRARKTSEVTVIAGPNEGDTCILYTAFGGPLAPKEPGDPTLADGTTKGRAEIEASREFWSQHALALVLP